MIGVRTLAVAVVLGAMTTLGVTACGGGEKPPAEAPKQEASAHWQDVFDGVPDVYVVLRPQSFKSDPIYGALYKTLIRIAQSKQLPGGASMIEAAEGCSEVIVGLNRNDNAAIVLRGVPASLDPQKMIDASGRPAFRLVSDKTKVPEYQSGSIHNGEPGSLFVLPERTWVGVIGPMRDRARQAFASPFNRPVPKVDPHALAVFRAGAALTQSPRYTKSPVFAPIVKKLASVTVALEPQKEGVVASLLYDDEDASAWSEMRIKQLFEVLASNPPNGAGAGDRPERPGGPRRPKTDPTPSEQGQLPSYDWLKQAKVDHQANTVIVKLPIPARLLEELPAATGADIAF